MKRPNSKSNAKRFPAELALLATCALLASCKTTTNTVESPHGMATFNAVPEEEHATRIGGSQIVALNGTRLPQPVSSIDLSPGDNEITVRFAWPDGGTGEADLSISAVSGRQYSLRYWPFPPDVQDEVGPVRPLAAEPKGLPPPPLAAALLATAFTTRTVEQTAKYAAYKNRARKFARSPAQYTDVVVTSDYQPDGIVCLERVTP